MKSRNDDHFDKSTKQSTDSGDTLSEGFSRREMLAVAGSTVSIASLSGCLTLGSSNENTGDGPEPPWTTEELAKYVEDGSTVTIYSASGDKPTYDALIDIINEEFDAGLELDLFNSHAGAVSQRVMQERQANKDRADVIITANDITAKIREDQDVADEWYEMSIGDKFWFSDELPQKNVYPWMVKALNDGPKSVMPLNKEIFDEKGLDIPNTYNDLFDDQYEGMEMAIADYVVSYRAGYIMKSHADKTDMGSLEWMRALMDHLEFVGVDSHSTGTREVAQGNIPLMFYNSPHGLTPFMEDTPMYANFVENEQGSTWKNELTINKNAPHPWPARLFVSAMLEESVQRRITDEVPQVVPGRTDLEYSTDNEYYQKLFSTNVKELTLVEQQPYIETAEKAKENGVFEL